MSGVGGDIAARIESLDVSLFEAVSSQSDAGDRRAWLAVQRSVRRKLEYVYLEIGSHLGGSIQQHLVDPRCREIISIDKRPLSQPDDRGQFFAYEGNSTARMLDNLRGVSAAQVEKIRCFDADARDIDPSTIPAPTSASSTGSTPPPPSGPTSPSASGPVRRTPRSVSMTTMLSRRPSGESCPTFADRASRSLPAS